MSLFGAESPDLLTTLRAAGIELLWHPSLSEASGRDVLDLLQSILDGDTRLDILCLEGSVIQGPNGSGAFHRLAGSDRPMRDWLYDLCQVARHVVAVGNCAAYGGITAAGGNPSEACGLQYDEQRPGGLLGAEFVDRTGLPVVNVAGCPTHPNWVTDTLTQLAAGEMERGHLDVFERPRSYTDHLVHHGCPRNEYYEYKASAEKPSDLGCMMEHMGCLGTQAHADCNTRLWNGSGSCLRGGYPCINCTAPDFHEPGHAFARTPKVAGIPVGLPTDMPKAWFVALSALAKAATPNRLKNNALIDHIQIPPNIHGDKKRE
ncbi:HupU protein [Mangrovimicrobium sediminis]|uniref:hydrogenase (acceptor) n=2 Tax=Mangrovimicrobium sediminis TaxID=2562682 RepID=A0A4Z0M4T9_9GAMM|nr:HupU protein [Haliea sp. SAOS-164]